MFQGNHHHEIFFHDTMIVPWFLPFIIMTPLVEETSLAEAISSHNDGRKSNTPTNSMRDLIVH